MENADDPTREYVRTIEWDMMEKSKFFPLSMLSSFCVRFSVYPLTLIKTRLQVQRHGETYTGLYDAATKIYKTEGIRGLYRGYWVRSIHIVSGVLYITTYQGMRHILSQYNAPQPVKAFVGGGAASLVGQTVIVPFDVLSQHLMVLGLIKQGSQHKATLNPLGLKLDGTRSKFRTTLDVAQIIYKKDGVLGFYRGFIASVYTYVPNSALWWTFYHFYQDHLEMLLPTSVSRLLIQCVAGMLGGFTTTIITNPMDTVRARLQVQRTETILKTFQLLWKEDGMYMFTKGLTARLVQSISFSFSIILGYETIKRLSIKEEHKHLVRW